MIVPRHFTHLLLCSVAFCNVAWDPALAQATTLASARQFDFDLPAQPLGSALLQFSRVTGLQVATSPDLLNGMRSTPLRGRMTAAQALRRLMSGSSIDGRIVGDTVTVTRRRVAGKPVSRATQAASSRTADPTAAGALQNDDLTPAATEIVVTGFRESLAKAQELKKAATGTSDVIVAQDIAAFPDQNLAEALQRIAGVAITRDSGEGRQISLRGLGPEFTRTQLNGMEVLTNTASGLDSRGAISRSRSFDYSVFASELFNQVTVQKSFAAEQDEGGIGGTIGLRTAKPFDYAGLTAVVSAKGQVNEHTKTLTPRAVGLISNRWGDFGALLSVAYSSADTIEYGFRNINWSQINFGAANVGPNISAEIRDKLVNASGADRVWSSRQQTYATWFAKRERLGITGALQYHPDDRTDVTLDILYGKLTNDRHNTAIGSGGTNGVAANDIRGTQVITDVTLDRYNSIVAASFDNVDFRSESRLSEDATEFWQVVLNGRTDLTDNVQLSGLAGWSKSNFNGSYDQTWLETVGKSFSFDVNIDKPRTMYGFDITDPATGWDVQRMETRADRIQSEFYNAEGQLAWRVGEGATLKLGGSFKQFENSAWQRRLTFVYEDLPGVPQVPTMLVPRSSIVPYLIADVRGAYATLNPDTRLDAGDTIAGSDFSIRERTYSGFGQFDMAGEIAGIGVRANVGLRYFRTTLTSKGTAITGGTLTPVTVENSYDDFLPALNVAFDLDRSLVFRVGAARNISRAGLGDMRAAATLNLAAFGGTISAGNPFLTPFRADSIDASLEYYDGERGFLAIGAFYKNMDSFITTETTPVPYNSTGYPLSLLTDGQAPDVLINFTRPVNGPGASIKGIEIAGKRDFDFLPGPLRHLGALGNLTIADGSSDVLYSGRPVDLPLPNLSKFSANATLYFETERWGVRGSAAIRGKYRVGTGGNGNIGEFFPSTQNYDASAYFNLTPRLKLTVEAINITDQQIVQYADRDAQRLMTNTVSGRTILFGATMRF
ncbi:TonB-dependent receptor [Sphingomonas suaedae]|uniref:TonB-dependent receptor n=1 Tax=Sphingomonas suaedae TaxID=2599297 RepID=A0A518RHJ1_9SPHN|nr:TonB-dependent receptor [Sphingomonas suaedae]QDX26937.1 TonB-dependent receptor [Sphingomonas suaedae]